ncbi:MAG: hypothetical protein ACK52I_02795 [Pseudomonadota bacterium]|jgi:hypothetical protein
MAEQQALFGFNDMRPKMSLRSIITRERIEEVKKLLQHKDGKGAEEKLREMREELEKLERRISNRQQK